MPAFRVTAVLYTSSQAFAAKFEDGLGGAVAQLLQAEAQHGARSAFGVHLEVVEDEELDTAIEECTRDIHAAATRGQSPN